MYPYHIFMYRLVDFHLLRAIHNAPNFNLHTLKQQTAPLHTKLEQLFEWES